MSIINPETLRLYFIMGSQNCTKNPADVLKEAIEGGITFFQFREKGHGAKVGSEKYKLAEELHDICQKHHIPFIVNDDLPLALAIDADGIHIGQEDEAVEKVREAIGNKILGLSVHTLPEAEAGVLAKADYFGVGPIFPTVSKNDARPVQGVEIIKGLREQGIALPIVGIGGITAANARSVIQAGADGISVISAISLAENIQKSAENLRKQID